MTKDNSSAQLVERLRTPERATEPYQSLGDLCREAADLIERLTRPQPSTGSDMGAQQADGLSQAEPVTRLGPTGFDPSRIGSDEHAALKRALLSSVKRRPIARRGND